MANIEAYGTNIVGSGGSGGGGLTQEEHEWLESLASYTPNMYDVNPNIKNVDTDSDSVNMYFYHSYNINNYPGLNKFPICGYKRLKINISSYVNYVTFQFQLADGSYSQSIPCSASANRWSDWIDIPENAVLFCINSTYSTGSYARACVSLSTSES